MATTDEDVLIEFLDFAAKQVVKAETERALAERQRRITATFAHRSGVQKTVIAERLGVSRPTLDAWIARVESTPDEIADVERNEYIARRTAAAS